MASKTRLTVLFWTAALLWAAMLVAEGVSLPNGFFKPGSIVLGMLVLLMGAFERWIWRWSILHPWFVSTPNLQGTWRGEVLSQWEDPNSGERIPPIEAYLMIRQTLSTIQARLITKDSSSELLAGSLVGSKKNGFSIVGTFLNVPRIMVRDTSHMHRGSLVLHVRGEHHPFLEGDYWTDRLTRGELRFTARSDALHSSFDQARAARFKKTLR